MDNGSKTVVSLATDQPKPGEPKTLADLKQEVYSTDINPNEINLKLNELGIDSQPQMRYLTRLLSPRNKFIFICDKLNIDPDRVKHLVGVEAGHCINIVKDLMTYFRAYKFDCAYTRAEYCGYIRDGLDKDYIHFLPIKDLKDSSKKGLSTKVANKRKRLKKR